MQDVTIYTRKFCPYCSAAKKLLKTKGAQFEEHDGTMNKAIRAEMIERSNGGTTYPQIFIGNTHVGGCDELYALEDDGKLDALLTG